MKEFRVGKGAAVRFNNSVDQDNFNRYISDITKYQLLTIEEEIECFTKIKKGDKTYIDKICKHNLRFVVSVAKQYMPFTKSNCITLMDLISEGNMGLYQAALKFDETRGFKFISYAIWWIRQKILSYIAENYKSVKIPYTIFGAINKINKEVSRLEQEQERIVNFDEINYLHTEDQFKTILNVKGTDISANSTFFNIDDEESSLLNRFQSHDNADNNINYIDLQANILEAISKFPTHIATCIIEKYGLNGNEPMTYEAIADKHDISVDNVRIRISKYLSKLKRTYNLEDNLLIKKETNYVLNDKNNIIKMICDISDTKNVNEIINGKNYEVRYLL